MKRIIKILIYSIVSLFLLAGISVYIMRNYLQGIILQRLQSEIETTFGNYYHLDYTQIQTSIDANTFGIKIIKPVFSTDTSQKDFVAIYPAIFFKADSFEIGGINIRKLFLSQSIELNIIALNNPDLVFLIHKRTKKDKTKQPTEQSNKAPKPQEKRKLIDEIFLEKLKIEKGNVNILHLNDITDTLYYGEKINLEVTKARIPTQSPEGMYTASKIGNILFSMSNVCFYPDGTSYSFLMDEIKFDAKQNTILCRQVNVYPEKTLLSMSKSSKFQKTFAEVQIGNLTVRGIDFTQIDSPAVQIRSVEIANSHFNLLRNKNMLLNKTVYKKSIQEALNDIKIPLKIDTVKLKNLHLTLAIHFPKHNDPAIIRLHHINGTLLHIDNTKQATQPMVLHANATIMKTGKLVFDASFHHHKPTHTYQAHITNMPFAEWNQVISRLANVELTSGDIKHITLKGSATSMETTGNIVFEYRDLQATVFKKDKHGNNKKAGFLTYVANGFLRLRNPDEGEEKPVSKDYYFKRQPYQGQIMLWIGGLLDGIEATLLNEHLKKKVDEVKAEKLKTRTK